MVLTVLHHWKSRRHPACHLRTWPVFFGRSIVGMSIRSGRQRVHQFATVRVGTTALLILGACMALSVGGCAHTVIDRDASDYRASIDDAAVIEPEERLPLRAITKERVRVVTWIPEGYKDEYAAGEEITLRWGEAWVTLEPEVRERCQNFGSVKQTGRLTRRVQQLLGLPPKDETRYFVTFEVAAVDLFRPCARPDVATTSCEKPPKDYSMSGAHAEFYANQTMRSYRDRGYPWTRLGYTYDWNPDSGEYGASEYVVRKDAPVRIVGEPLETAAYCR